MVIGEGYADAATQLPQIPNTFAPVAPASYSDNTHRDAYVLATTSSSPRILRRTIVFQQEARDADQPISRGVHPLTYRDAIRIGYLESKVYAGADTLLQGMWAMENTLIAKDINNARKHRANLSFKYADERGRLGGYLVAYEGARVREGEESPEKRQERCIYILDWAADPSNKLAGGRVIQTFIDQYVEQYLEKGNVIPIFAETRESTSYPILMHQLEKHGKELGVIFELEELSIKGEGKNRMHPVVIRPQRTSQ